MRQKPDATHDPLGGSGFRELSSETLFVVFDDGHIENIRLLDKKNVLNNELQVIKQFQRTGSQANRYDVTTLVNGLPLVQRERKSAKPLVVKGFFGVVGAEFRERFN